MNDSRVNAPMKQPLNTNELREVVWEHIDLDNSNLQTVEIAVGNYRDHYDIAKTMFDKNVNTGVPATLQFQIEQNFKKPVNILSTPKKFQIYPLVLTEIFWYLLVTISVFTETKSYLINRISFLQEFFRTPN